MYKIGHVKNNQTLEHKTGNNFEHEVYEKWSRVSITCESKQIQLMLEIAKTWAGPFGILYVLEVSRLGNQSARYQSPRPSSYDELELFAYSFQEYFEKDGRHHIWFIDISSNYRLVYDNHNIIYAYGNDNQVIDLLKTKGFEPREIQIPDPHTHNYNVEFDDSEAKVLEYFEWLQFPINPEHD